ncbi:MAG: transposase [Verrucomicrobiales bacterium]|nr:transposase [Verrucomicrobiales bacterium]
MRIPADRPVGFYHCLSRIVDRRRIFGDGEKERFVALMRECERFCRVRVLTYAVMANHFHILVEVPKRPDSLSLPGPEEIIAELRRLSGHQSPEAVEQRFATLRAAKDDEGVARFLATFHARMYDVSAFMKMLKQRFTQWYNGRQGRKGTLWEERFRSVLVDGAGESLATMAAYIDLNPVRAGLAKDPKDYRWCGYAEAMAGRKRARAGIQFLATTLRQGHEEPVARSMETYREHLFLEGDERRQTLGPDGRPVRGSMSATAVAEVLKARGKLPLSEYLKCRVRYFNDGAALGGKEFVEGIFEAYRQRFGANRKTGARAMRGLSSHRLFTLRDLQSNVFG